MPIDINRVASETNPENTVLFFGAGASLSSHAPSVNHLVKHLENIFKLSGDGFSLREF